ncbi:MAG TPA: hypothetical protein VG125_25585 [Pirellulales bacterium]|jgi:hypothetical protein|nr:hypothetical protein [Pirellulales bacterium]
MNLLGSAARRRAPYGLLLIAVLLALPLSVSTVPAGRGLSLVVDWPRVFSGDEPHYLLMLNSLIRDGDLDLRNNYTAVWQGSQQAGRSFAGRPLDHHTKWYEGNRLIAWGQGASSTQPPAREYSWHPPGLPLLLAPLLWPLRDTRWVEPAALACTALATFAGLGFFCLLVRGYLPDQGPTWPAAAVAFLGTPLWPYARTLYCEPYLATLAIGAYALAFRRSAYFSAGILLAVGVTMKPPFVLMALPLAAAMLVGGGLRAIACLGLPICLAVVWVFSWNYWMHGSVFRSPIQWAPGDIYKGAVGLLSSRTHGLLPMAPAALPVIAAWPTFLRRHPREALSLLAACGLYFALMANWVAWDGGACYGPRMIVPILPLLFAAAAMMPACGWWSFQPLRGAAIGACLLSILFNAVAAFSHGQSWNHHPVDVIAKWFS